MLEVDSQNRLKESGAQESADITNLTAAAFPLFSAENLFASIRNPDSTVCVDVLNQLSIKFLYLVDYQADKLGRRVPPNHP